jgi:glycerol-3-phosphate dehydrogenase
VPWNGRYLIGTTDFRYEDDLDYVSADVDEIEYLVDETNAVVPRAGLTREDVLFTYSGLSPCPSAPPVRNLPSPGLTLTSTTRTDVRPRGASQDIGRTQKGGGLISIIGGKLTTYRNLGGQTVDAVYEKLGRPVARSRADRRLCRGAPWAGSKASRRSRHIFR